MTIEQARVLYEELRDKYEACLAEYDVKFESEIYFEDDDFERPEDLNKATIMSLDINIFTESIDKDNGICFCASVTVAKGRVDDDEILEDNREFERSICEFLDKLGFASSPDELIAAEVEDGEQKLDEMMQEFQSKMKKTTVIAYGAIAVAVVVAVVAILFSVFA